MLKRRIGISEELMKKVSKFSKTDDDSLAKFIRNALVVLTLLKEETSRGNNAVAIIHANPDAKTRQDAQIIKIIVLPD